MPHENIHLGEITALTNFRSDLKYIMHQVLKSLFKRFPYESLEFLFRKETRIGKPTWATMRSTVKLFF